MTPNRWVPPWRPRYSKADFMNSLELTSEYESSEIAEAVAAALDPENEGFVKMEVRGKTIYFEMEAESAGSLRNTADDLLSCLKIAEEASGLVRSPASDFDGDSSFE